MTGSVPPPPPPPFNQPSGGGSMNHYNSPHTDLYNRRTFPGQFPQGMQPGMNMASAPPSTSHRSSFPQGQVPPPPPPPPSAHQQHPSMSPQQSYGMPMHMQQQNPYAQSPYPMMNPMAQPGMGQMQMGYPPQMQPPGMHQMQSGHPGYMGAAMNPYTGMPMAPGYGQMGMNPYGYGPAYNPVDAAARAYHEGYDGHGSGRDSHRHRHSHASSSAQAEGDRKWHQDIFDQTVNVISKLPPATLKTVVTGAVGAVIQGATQARPPHRKGKPKPAAPKKEATIKE